MAYEDYTINQFKNAWFKNDRSVMNESVFNTVYTEYIDTAGLYQVEEFEKVSYIHYINNRINSIKLSVRLQRDFINNFDIPYLDGLKFFKKFGHIIFWNKDLTNFLHQLEKVESKEKKFISILEGKIKELADFRAKKNVKEYPIKQTREAFLKTINSLGKCGFKIDNDKTTVEEFALMIKQQTEENNNSKN